MVSAPERVAPGQHIPLSGKGFKAASEVEIVLDSPSHEVVGSTVARSDGSFKTSVTLPRADRGKDKLQVLGTSAAGKVTELNRVVLVAANKPVNASSGSGLARPVLLTLVGVIPLTTWLVLEALGWRSRRTGPGGTTR